MHRRPVWLLCFAVLIGLLLRAGVERIPHWLIVRDQLVPADAILVLDGGDVRFRLAVGLDLARRGYAPRLLVSRPVFGYGALLVRESREQVRPEHMRWVPSAASSTGEEARAVRETLRSFGCRRLLLVTSDYHTRRARTIFRKELQGEGIEVRVYPAPSPAFAAGDWWETQDGRQAVLSELAKVTALALHLDLPFSGERRFRVTQEFVAWIP